MHCYYVDNVLLVYCPWGSDWGFLLGGGDKYGCEHVCLKALESLG